MKNIAKNQGISVYLLGILAIFLAISGPWFDLSVSNHSFVKTYVAGIGVGLLVLLTLWQKQYFKEISFHMSYIKLFLGATFALGLLSILWSANPDFSITKLFIWITIFMAFYVAYNLQIHDEMLHKLALLMVIAAGSIAVIGIGQYLFDAFTITQAATPSSTFGNRNMATQPISLIFPLAVYLILSKRTTNTQLWLATILIALSLVFIFYTSTRAAWIAISGESVLIVLFFIFKHKEVRSWASWNRQKTLATLSAVGLFAILINFNADGFYPFWEKATANFDRLASSLDNAKDLRYQIWSVAVQMVKDAPFFGHGIGTWFHNLVQEGYSTYIINYVQRVHNDILEMAVSIGLIGVSVFLAGVVAVIYAVWKVILKAEKDIAFFYFALFVALSGSFVNMQFSFPYQLAMPALLFGFYIGLIAKKSEEFVRPIKLIILKLNKPKLALYKNSIVTLNTVIFIVISSVYMSWANMYSTLDKLNRERSFNKMSIVKTPVYHLEIQNIMNFLAFAYIKGGQWDIAEKVVTQALKYWPNDYVTRSRYAFILQQKKQYNRAIEVAKRAKESSPANSEFANQILFSLYLQTKQYDKYISLFTDILKTPEEILGDNPKMYKSLVANALRINSLLQYVPDLYQKHYKYNNYDCNLENNILTYYILTKDNDKLAKKFITEVSNPKNCISNNLLNQVKSKLKLK
jgi:putative inorganic carbon (HCO3(-)) transporter